MQTTAVLPYERDGNLIKKIIMMMMIKKEDERKKKTSFVGKRSAGRGFGAAESPRQVPAAAAVQKNPACRAW